MKLCFYRSPIVVGRARAAHKTMEKHANDIHNNDLAERGCEENEKTFLLKFSIHYARRKLSSDKREKNLKAVFQNIVNKS